MEDRDEMRRVDLLDGEEGGLVRPHGTDSEPERAPRSSSARKTHDLDSRLAG